jgi:hypothetical protein
MPLPKLNWKMLPPYIIPMFSNSPVKLTGEGLIDSLFNAFSVDTYYDGSPRVTGSGVAWSFFRTSSFDVSPTVIGAPAFIYGFPATSSIMSQSIVFAATRSSWPVGGSTTFNSREQIPLMTPSISLPLSSNSLYAFHVRGADRRGWSKAAPTGAFNIIYNFFNSGSTVITSSFSGSFFGSIGINIAEDPYNRDYPYGKITDWLSINIWESEEAIMVVGNTKSTGLYTSAISSSTPAIGNPGGAAVNYANIFLGGAIFDPILETTSSTFPLAEVDGRLYGLMSNRVHDVKDHITMELHRFSGGMGNVYYDRSSTSRENTSDRFNSSNCFYILPDNVPFNPPRGTLLNSNQLLINNPMACIANFANFYAKSFHSSSNIGRSNNDSTLSYNLSNSSNKSILLPIYMISNHSQTLIGKLRDVYTGKKMRSGIILKSGSLDYAYCVSPSMYNNEECFYLKS